MKFTPEVIAALETLRKNAENDFELHRISVLEKDLTAPPVVEIIDDKHQRFDGLNYYKSNYGYYLARLHGVHRTLWQYCYGEIPPGYEIHHRDLNTANNAIENLQMLSSLEHRKLHYELNTNFKKKFPEITRKCLYCGHSFKVTSKHPNQKYCSRNCVVSALHEKRTQNTGEKICPQCGKVFSVNSKSKNQVCCSRNCSGKMQFLKNPYNRFKEKICPVCGKIFQFENSSKKCCSRKCSAKLGWATKRGH